MNTNTLSLNSEIKHTEGLLKYTKKSVLKRKQLNKLKELMYYKDKYPEGDYMLSGLIIGDALKSIRERISY